MGNSSAGDHADHCRSCPVCLVLRALDDLRPEVRAHLEAAGRELLLALRAAVADVATGASSGDDVSTRQRCGTSPHDDRAHRPPYDTPLRRIAVD